MPHVECIGVKRRGGRPGGKRFTATFCRTVSSALASLQRALSDSSGGQPYLTAVLDDKNKTNFVRFGYWMNLTGTLQPLMGSFLLVTNSVLCTIRVQHRNLGGHKPYLDDCKSSCAEFCGAMRGFIILALPFAIIVHAK